MKILLVHPNPLQDYHLERLINESLIALGHEVSLIRYRGLSDLQLYEQLQLESSKVDFTIVLKGEMLKEQHYKIIQSLSCIWYVDHPPEGLFPDWLVLGCSHVDLVFMSSYGLIEKMKRYNPNVYWVVEGAHLPLLQPQKNEQTKDVSFFGSVVHVRNDHERCSFLRELAEKYDFHLYGGDSTRKFSDFQFTNAYGPVWNEDLAKAISETKIVIGFNSPNTVLLYWSNRLYVTLACKGFLITAYVPGIERVFENHKDLVWFSSREELYELIEYYLNNPEQREKIAQQGYEKVCAVFSTQTQVEKLLKIANEKLDIPTKKKRVLFVTDSGYVGCANASKHWAALLTSKHLNVDHFIVREPIEKEVCDQYDIVIVGGYSSKYEGVFQSTAKKCLVWQSSIFQTQLEGEVSAIRNIKRLESEKKIDQVIVGDLNTLKLFSNAVWVPNFSFFEPVPSTKQIVDSTKINLCALGPSKNRKNLFTVLAAFQYLSDQHVLHINVSPEYYQANIEGVFNTERVINHDWMEQRDYYALIKQCVAGFQVSVAESYDYVAAEHLLLGTPVICSNSIPAVAIEALTVRNHEDGGELLGKLDVVKRASGEQKGKWTQEFREFDAIRMEKAAQQLLYRVAELPEKVILSKDRPALSLLYIMVVMMIMVETISED
jgi:glycosyltransferase involved in cell wall biosynthesis